MRFASISQEITIKQDDRVYVIQAHYPAHYDSDPRSYTIFCRIKVHDELAPKMTPEITVKGNDIPAYSVWHGAWDMQNVSKLIDVYNAMEGEG